MENNSERPEQGPLEIETAAKIPRGPLGIESGGVSETKAEVLWQREPCPR